MTFVYLYMTIAAIRNIPAVPTKIYSLKKMISGEKHQKSG